MNAAWHSRSREVFVEKTIRDFVDRHMERAIKNDVCGQMLEQIKHARTRKDLSVSCGLCYDPNYRFFGADGQSMTIKQLIYRTDALQRFATEIGPQIKVSPHYWNDLIYFDIEFWPTRV